MITPFDILNFGSRVEYDSRRWCTNHWTVAKWLFNQPLRSLGWTIVSVWNPNWAWDNGITGFDFRRVTPLEKGIVL